MLLTCVHRNTVAGVPRLWRCSLAVLAALAAGSAAAHIWTVFNVERHHPPVESITLSDPAVGDTYTQGETITATVRWSHSIRTNSGCDIAWDGTGPVRLQVEIGAATRTFSCPRLSGNHNPLAFTYQVQRDDVDPDGISIRNGALLGPIAHHGWTNRPIPNTLSSTVEIVNSANHNVAGSAISSTTPSQLTDRNLDGATLAVELTGTTFGSGVTAASFELVPTIPGLSIDTVSTVASGAATSTLTLAFAGDALPRDTTLAVRVLNAAHAGGLDLTSTTIPVEGSETETDLSPEDRGELVALADPVVARAVARALGRAPGTVRTLDLMALRSLSLDGAGVSSLAGLEAARWLESVSLGGNAPAAGGAPLDLSPLAGLTALEALTLSGNGFDDISALSALTALRQLWLDGNDLSDVSALAALGSLIYLHLGDNRIADVSPLAGLSALRRLWLRDNMVADVSALAGLRELRRLDLSRNRIADASPLRGLTRLSRNDFESLNGFFTRARCPRPAHS